MKKILICILIFYSHIQSQNSFFDFTVDERLFLSFAFMNAAGNDGEWNSDGMHPIRIEVRKYLDETLGSTFRKEITNFTKQNKMRSWSYYSTLGMISNGPPNFELLNNLDTNFVSQESIDRFLMIRNYLIEFYQKSNFEKLWNKYQSKLQEENNKFQPYAEDAINDIVNYCKLDEGYFINTNKKLSFQFMPLMSYFTAQTISIKNIRYIISGPMKSEPSKSSFYHEALHQPIGAIIDNYKDKISKLNRINELNNKELGYAGWLEFFEECLVRTVSWRLINTSTHNNRNDLNQNIQREYKRGMILCAFFNEELDKYELSDFTLNEYLEKIISDLNYDKESERLKEFKEFEK